MEGEFRPLTDHIEQPSERLRNMVATHHHSCTLCEATCGITVTTDGDRVVDVRGDEHDPISRGYICPKATALADLHHDPDRLKRPLVKRDGEFGEVSWREAFDLVGDGLRAIRAKYGQHALGLRTSRYGLRKPRGGLSLRKLRRQPHGVDLGPLERRLPGRLYTKDRKIHLAPGEYLDDLDRLHGRMESWAPGELVLIGRRQLRSGNSWLHNSARLVKGKPRCTLLVNPADAERYGLADHEPAVLSSAAGEVEVPVELTDQMMPGVVSLPHGWGHSRPGVRLDVASKHAGASINDVTDDQFVDELTGTAALSGQRVKVRAVQPAAT